MANTSLSTGDYGNGLADQAQQTGSSAISAFNPTAQANSVRSGFNDLANQQQGTVQGFTNTYANAVAANPDVRSLYNQANEQFGVPQLAQRANYLNTQVTNQLPMQQQLMRGFDANQNQVDNATNQALRYLQPQATAATNASQTAQNLANQSVGYGITQNQMNLLPVQQQGQMLNDVLARQATGYTTAAQSELQGYIDKMNAGVQLSQAEYQRANQLAQAEASYNSQIQSQTIASQNITLGQGQTYYNPVTGTAYNPFTTVAKP